MECCNLLALPEDILRDLLYYMSTFERYALWRVSRRARFLLEERGVMKTLTSLYTSRVMAFPRFSLKMKALHTLKVSFGMETSLGLTWRVLESLPSTLTSLTLSSKDTYQSFYKGPNSPCPMKSDWELRTGRLRYITTTRKACTAKEQKYLKTMLCGTHEDLQDVVDLSKITPLLETLSLRGCGTQAGFNLLPHLPDTITHLNLGHHGEFGSITTGTCPSIKFPKSLAKLIIYGCNSFDAFHLLPPEIMSVCFNEGCVMSGMRLPPSIVSWDGPLSNPHPSLGDPFAIPALSSITSTASSLQNMSVFPGTSVRSTLLVHGIGSSVATSSSVPSTSSNAGSFHNWSMLPITLTSLDINQIRGDLSVDQVIDIIHLNSIQLTRLTIRSTTMAYLQDQHLEKLPQSLTMLCFVASPTITSDFYGLLPRKITDLCVYRTYRDPEVNLPNDDPKIANLPPNLTKLYLFIHRYLPSSSIALLPRTLTYFSPASPKWSSDDPQEIPSFHNYPPKIRDFTIDRDPKIFPPTALTTLPSGIVSITIHGHSEFGDEHIKLMPVGLISLRMLDNLSVTDAGMNNLPPKLEILDLQTNCIVTDAGLMHLPVTLRQLDLRGSASGITGQIVPYLPRGLQRLALRKVSSWKDEDLKFLPPELQFLTLHHGTELTDACFDYFPKTLSSFSSKLNRLITPAILPKLSLYMTELNLMHNPNFNKSHFDLVPKGVNFFSKGLVVRVI